MASAHLGVIKDTVGVVGPWHIPPSTKKYSIAICCIILQSMLLLNTTHIIIRIQTLHDQSLKYMKARVIPPNKHVQVRQVGAGGPLPPSIAFARSCWTKNGIAWKEPELQLAEAFLGSAT